MSVLVNAHGEINDFTTHGAALELDVQTIQINHGVALVERPFLPLMDVIKYGSSNVANGCRGIVAAKHTLNKTRYVSRSHA
ncbi:hypothetical protein D3C74_324880 [compost metagenome]